MLPLHYAPWHRLKDLNLDLLGQSQVLYHCAKAVGGPGWTRTNDVSYVTDLQSAAVAAMHTDPYI